MYGRSYGSVLDACAASYGNQEALVQGDVRLSYAEVMHGIRRTGRALRALGLQPGDRVAFVMSDSLDLVNIMYGALWAGLTIVPLNARLQLDDHVYMVKDAGARALAFDGPQAERGHAILEQAGVEFAIATEAADVPLGGLLLDDMLRGHEGGPGAPEVDTEGECWIQYTGGTTGFPKGALHSHRTFLTAMLGCAFELDVQAGERHVHCAPLTHSGLAYFLPVWMRGGRTSCSAASTRSICWTRSSGSARPARSWSRRCSTSSWTSPASATATSRACAPSPTERLR
jgi:acyl-CoA synthetase (AMP-forming)/AMP-acid ligase II